MVLPIMWSMGFGFTMMTLNIMWVATQNKYIMDWPIHPTRGWWICKPISQGRRYWHSSTLDSNCNKGRHFLRVLGLQQLQHSSSLDHIFCVPPKLDAHLTSKFSKITRQIPTTLFLQSNNIDVDHKWRNSKLMDWYYIVRFTAIPYPRFRVINNVVSHEDSLCLVTIGDLPQCTCIGPHQNGILGFWKER